MEVKLKEGFLLYVPDNPPKWSAEACQCSRHPRCVRYLWAGALMFRSLRGSQMHILCAVRDKLSSQEELEEGFQELLQEGDPPETRSDPPKVDPPKPPETRSDPPKVDPPEKPKTKPKTKLPFSATPWSEVGDLEEDAFANAPAHIRKRLLEKSSR